MFEHVQGLYKRPEIQKRKVQKFRLSGVKSQVWNVAKKSAVAVVAIVAQVAQNEMLTFIIGEPSQVQGGAVCALNEHSSKVPTTPFTCISSELILYPLLSLSQASSFKASFHELQLHNWYDLPRLTEVQDVWFVSVPILAVSDTPS